MRFGNYNEKEFDDANHDAPVTENASIKDINNKYDHQYDSPYLKKKWVRPSNTKNSDPQNDAQLNPPFLDDQSTKEHTTPNLIKNTWRFKVEDPYHVNPFEPPVIHRVLVGFDDLNQVQDDTTDEILDNLNKIDWIEDEPTNPNDYDHECGDDQVFHCDHYCCNEIDHQYDYYDCDDASYDEANDLYDFYNEILNQYQTARDRYKADTENESSWTREEDPVDELVNRLGWVTSGLLTGELGLVSAMDAIDNLYDGIEDDLNAIVDNDKRIFNEHEVGPIGSESNKKNESEAIHTCECASGDRNEFDGCRGREYNALYYKLTQLSWYLRKLREVLDLTDDPATDPDVNANKAGMLIEAVVHAIVWDDLLTDALQNPDDDLERDFNKWCLEEDCAEMIKLLSHAKTNYVVGYAIRTWMNRLNDQVIGGLEALTRDCPSLRKLDNGRLIID